MDATYVFRSFMIVCFAVEILVYLKAEDDGVADERDDDDN